MNKSKTASFIFWLIITIVPIAGLLLSILNPAVFQQSQDGLRAWLLPWGIAAPIAFVLLQALQVVIAPISHYSVGLLGGFLYGPWLGGLLNWIGRLIGHVVAFLLSRFVGRSIANRFVSPVTLAKYDKYVSGQSLILFFIYFLPLFPDDEISYLAGLSKMKFRVFLAANLLGHIGGSLSLSYLGSGLSTKDPIFWVLSAVTLVGFVIVWWIFRRDGLKKAVSSVAN